MWAIVFNGKIETKDADLFINEFQKLINNTDSEFFGKIEKYHFIEYADYQKIDEPKTIESNDSEVETTDNTNV